MIVHKVITYPEDNSDLDETSCTGIIEQGGMVLCKTTPNTEVKIGRSHF